MAYTRRKEKINKKILKLTIDNTMLILYNVIVMRDKFLIHYYKNNKIKGSAL